MHNPIQRPADMIVRRNEPRIDLADVVERHRHLERSADFVRAPSVGDSVRDSDSVGVSVAQSAPSPSLPPPQSRSQTLSQSQSLSQSPIADAALGD